ncbi:MAG TPA: cupredoxin domain-containing protein [Gaiellaceae bacterium]|nr:cupredoxin domain-containing protein [Gaiellaceae bacterium]
MRTLGRVSVLLAGALVAALALAVAAAGGTGRAAQAPQRITVTMTEFTFALKPKTARRGVVVFTVVNRGAIAHDFRIAGKGTPAIAAGKRATLRVTFKKAGRYPFVCTLPSHASAGMKGVLIVRP